MPKKTKKIIKKVKVSVKAKAPIEEVVVPLEAPHEPVGIHLKCAGRVFMAVGDTLEDALQKIKISGGIEKLGGVLTVQQGERKRVKILSGSLTRMLFGHISNTAKLIGLKRIKSIFT